MRHQVPFHSLRSPRPFNIMQLKSWGSSHDIRKTVTCMFGMSRSRCLIPPKPSLQRCVHCYDNSYHPNTLHQVPLSECWVPIAFPCLLAGTLDDYGFESYLGLPENCMDAPPDLHSQMEQKLGLGSRPMARGLWGLREGILISNATGDDMHSLYVAKIPC